MGQRSRQIVCFALFRILLPLTQLAAAIVRFSGFSLIYGCLAMVTPLLRRPTASTIRQSTGRYLLIALLLSAVTMLSQTAFQLYGIFEEPSNSSALAPCSPLESTLRQIGLQLIHVDDPVNAVRIVLPDVGVFIITLLIFIICRVTLHERLPNTDDTAASTALTGTDRTNVSAPAERRLLFKYGVMIADFLGNFVVVMMMGACGIALPSILNSVYFVLFIAVMTMWSCCARSGSWFAILRYLLLIYVAVHVILIYLTQFEFMQHAWDSHGNNTLVERILELPRFVRVDCQEPWIVSVSPDVPWTYYLDVALLLFFYFILALEIRRRLEPMPTTGQAQQVASSVSRQYVNPAAETEGQTETQGLIEMPSAVPSYHSLDAVDDEADAAELPNVAEDVVVHQPTGGTQSAGSSSSVISILFQFCTHQSYIGMLIIMMAWSIVYHSWLNFVLLIAACLIWMVPKKRQLCLRCSPVVVVYAICLITLQYVYGFNLNDDELPTVVNGYPLKEIGLVKYSYPVGPLAVQIAFTLVFWLTLRQFTFECTTRRHGSRLDAESLETLNETDGDAKPKVESLSVQVLKYVGSWLHGMLSKYWILICSVLFLVLAIQEPNVYRIIYMVLFLYFVITFQLSYKFWRFCVRLFWWVVVLYSMVVLTWIYVFQFEDVLSKWQNATGMTDDQVADLGLERYDTSRLLIELLTPTSFLIFVILHIHYFQQTFLRMSDICRRSTSDLQVPSVAQTASNRGKRSSFVLSMNALRHKVVELYNSVTKLLWRLAEIHIHKLVMLAVFILCTLEVNALNVVYFVLIVILLPFPSCHTLMSHLCQLYTAVIILAKMFYQLHWIPADIAESNCTEVINMNTSAGIPDPFNKTIDSAAYLGFEKLTDSGIILADYIKNYVIILVLMAFEAIVRVHQAQYYNHPDHVRPPPGIVFNGITRADADRDLTHCAKFLVNYAFYKFGREICFIMTVITMVVRLDLYSVIYGVFLGILVLLSRRCCYRLWPGYVVILIVLLVFQYLSCVGAPLALCWEYPWNIIGIDNKLKIFLFLPNYSHPPPYGSKLIPDFFQLLFVCLQWKVFSVENYEESDAEGGCNRSVIPSIQKENPDPNPREDFITYKDSYLDYVKIVVFYFSFWITLLIVFITGTSRISLFCMGYLSGCFLILWFGRDLLLKPIRSLLWFWSLLLMYSYLVLMMKCCLQLVGCVYWNKTACVIRQLFSTTCIHASSYKQEIPAGYYDSDCPLDNDDAGLSWDAVSFAFLLMMSRVYKTWYFQHARTDLEIDSELAARGTNIINEALVTRVQQRKAHEANVVNKIKRKLERIKLRQGRLGKVAESTDHYIVIRSGDYYMFDDISDDETETSDEQLDEMQVEEDEEPGPLELINAGITSGAKGALDLYRRQSVSSPEDVAGADVESPPADEVPEVPGPSTSAAEADAAITAAEEDEDTAEDKDHSAEDKEPVTTGVTNIFKVIWLIFCAFLKKLVLILNQVSSEYRDVSRQLAKEKKQMKLERQGTDRGPDDGSSPVEDTRLQVASTPTRPSSISLRVEGEPPQDEVSADADQQQAEFERDMPLPLQLIKAIFDVLLSHSELLCYFAMVLNAMVTGSLLSIVYPVLAFLWAMLSSPRPSKSFWVFTITYTEVLIIVKYIFQFNFYMWNQPENDLAKQYSRDIMNPLYIFGIEKKNDYAVFDLFLLFSLFVHRSVLKRYGLWKDADATSDDLRKAENVVVSQQNTPATSPQDPNKAGRFHSDSGGGDAQAIEEGTDAGGADGLDDGDETRRGKTSCFQSTVKVFRDFYQQMTNPQYSAVTDVYALMFMCDLITFIIVVFGYASFGPSSAGGAEVVTSVITQNRVPMPFLGMLLVQFILIIIDRALYLRKQVIGKFILQIILVFGVHAWIFFGLPAITHKRFTDNLVAQIWYFTKCVYFALSAYQIRCGYPTRILGNFLTKKYNYLYLICFKGFLVIPFLHELRALMDWMFTDTTLALTSWLQMEDIFANVFCIKCERHAERKFRVERGIKRRAIVKYGSGGLLLFLLIFIIWFPLVLFSLSATIFVPDPPVDVTVNVRFWGYQTIFTMSAQQQWLQKFTDNDYNRLSEQVETSGQAFLGIYEKEDIYRCHFDGTSGSKWDISPPNIERLHRELISNPNVSIYVTVDFTRNPSPGLSTETVSGLYMRILDRKNATDNETMNSLADMLLGNSGRQAVTITQLYPHYWTVPATGTAEPSVALLSLPQYYGTVSLALEVNTTLSAMWWTLSDVSNATVSSKSLWMTSFNQRIAPSSVLSMATNYGVIGLYLSLVLVIGRFVRMWLQGLSFKIMFVELPVPDFLVKLCLDIYLVRECGELRTEEDLFSQLLFLYRSPETLIKVTKQKVD